MSSATAFYCTAYAAAGSLVNKPSDAYNVSFPVQVPLLIVSYILTFTVLYGSSVYGFYWFLSGFPADSAGAMPTLVAIGVAHPGKWRSRSPSASPPRS